MPRYKATFANPMLAANSQAQLAEERRREQAEPMPKANTVADDNDPYRLSDNMADYYRQTDQLDFFDAQDWRIANARRKSGGLPPIESLSQFMAEKQRREQLRNPKVEFRQPTPPRPPPPEKEEPQAPAPQGGGSEPAAPPSDPFAAAWQTANPQESTKRQKQLFDAYLIDLLKDRQHFDSLNQFQQIVGGLPGASPEIEQHIKQRMLETMPENLREEYKQQETLRLAKQQVDAERELSDYQYEQFLAKATPEQKKAFLDSHIYSPQGWAKKKADWQEMQEEKDAVVIEKAIEEYENLPSGMKIIDKSTIGGPLKLEVVAADTEGKTWTPPGAERQKPAEQATEAPSAPGWMSSFGKWLFGYDQPEAPVTTPARDSARSPSEPQTPESRPSTIELDGKKYRRYSDGRWEAEPNAQ